MFSSKLDTIDPTSSPLDAIKNNHSGEIELLHQNTNRNSIELEFRDARNGNCLSSGIGQTLIKGGIVIPGLSCHIDAED
jgi:hypothetical protein